MLKMVIPFFTMKVCGTTRKPSAAAAFSSPSSDRTEATATSALLRTSPVADDEFRTLRQEQSMLRAEKEMLPTDTLRRLQEIEARDLEIKKRIEIEKKR